jgi:hypothetical protein
VKCIAGRHNWLSEFCARRCCNGFHQELRDIADPKRYEGAEIDGAVHVAGERLIFVWVRDPLPEESIAALADKLQFLYTRDQVIEWIWNPQKHLEGWTPRALIERGQSSRIWSLIAALADGAFL